VPVHVIEACADRADIKVTEKYRHARRGPMDEAARKLEQRYTRKGSVPAEGFVAGNVARRRQGGDLIV
jgi:hypothetical protein